MNDVPIALVEECRLATEAASTLAAALKITDLMLSIVPILFCNQRYLTSNPSLHNSPPQASINSLLITMQKLKTAPWGKAKLPLL
jgi:hypothetical protein